MDIICVIAVISVINKNPILSVLSAIVVFTCVVLHLIFAGLTLPDLSYIGIAIIIPIMVVTIAGLKGIERAEIKTIDPLKANSYNILPLQSGFFTWLIRAGKTTKSNIKEFYEGTKEGRKLSTMPDKIRKFHESVFIKLIITLAGLLTIFLWKDYELEFVFNHFYNAKPYVVDFVLIVYIYLGAIVIINIYGVIKNIKQGKYKNQGSSVSRSRRLGRLWAPIIMVISFPFKISGILYGVYNLLDMCEDLLGFSKLVTKLKPIVGEIAEYIGMPIDFEVMELKKKLGRIDAFINHNRRMLEITRDTEKSMVESIQLEQKYFGDKYDLENEIRGLEITREQSKYYEDIIKFLESNKSEIIQQIEERKKK